MEETRRSYDVLAERYAARVGGELAGKPMDRALLASFAEVTRGGPVVDLGCGPGHVTAHLAGLGVRVCGLDLSVGMCSVGRRSGFPFVAGDLTALPLASSALWGVVCLYAVIHLDASGRSAAYKEMGRVLRPGGRALVAFHVSDDDVPAGEEKVSTSMWDVPVDLTFRFLDPDAEVGLATDAGLVLAARTDRAPYPGVEHPSHRSYLLFQSHGPDS